METITVKLSEKAEKQFHEIMYSLPNNDDESELCTEDQAVSYAFECLALFEEKTETDIITFLDDFQDQKQPNFKDQLKAYQKWYLFKYNSDPVYHDYFIDQFLNDK